MKKLMILTAFALCGLSLAADSAAFTYQAKLKEATGELSVTNANLAVEIRLYKTAGGSDALWGRLFNVLTDAQGNFNLLVSDDGSVLNDTPATATLAEVMKAQQAGELYLGLKVANKTPDGKTGDEIKPRQRIFAVPFAAVANDVRAISGDITVGGKIQLGTDKDGVVISKDGIKQTSQTGVETSNLSVLGGTVTVNGSELLPVPVGGVIMWTKETPPDAADWASSSHWAICDGQNGTPNLTDRFVVAASPAGKGEYALNDQGGQRDVILNIDQLPSHAHPMPDMTTAAMSGAGGVPVWFSGGPSASATMPVGDYQPHENRPPYYALYYIMRIK